MKIMIEISSDKAVEWLIKRAIMHGVKREHPTKRWTDRERREFCKLSIQALLVEAAATENA